MQLPSKQPAINSGKRGSRGSDGQIGGSGNSTTSGGGNGTLTSSSTAAPTTVKRSTTPSSSRTPPLHATRTYTRTSKQRVRLTSGATGMLLLFFWEY